jgi:ribosomal-protein-alanine N-acetyltransferase
VLIRNGFRPFAVAESYLKIAGRWQDHIMFCLLNKTAENGHGPTAL